MSADRLGLGGSLLAVGLPFAWLVWRHSIVLAAVGAMTAAVGMAVLFTAREE